MIRHCVFLRLRPEITDEVAAGLMGEIADLGDHLSGIVEMHFGDNVSPELGMDKGFSRGFMIDFESAADRDDYLADEAHKAVGAKLGAAAVDGAEGVIVFDFEI